MKTYQTLVAPTQSEYKEKGSKFLAFSFAIDSEEEAKLHLNALQVEYSTAHHHCFAYLLADPQGSMRAYDDGEPNNSAGMPILNQIKSFGLANVLVVVVRYFGGTKLGVSGLVNAYKTAAREALLLGEVVEKFPQKQLSLQYPYSQTSTVKQLLQRFETEVLQESFTEICQIDLKIKCSQIEALKSYLSNHLDIKIQLEGNTLYE